LFFSMCPWAALGGRLFAAMRGELLEYVLTEGFDRTTVARHLDVETDPTISVARAYYDTFDGRLHDRGLTLVHADGRLVVLDARNAERAAVEQPEQPERIMAGDLPPGPLRGLLEPLIDVRALLPTARTRSRVRRLRIVDDEVKTVVRLVVEEPRLVGSGTRTHRLDRRLQLVPVRGYDKELARVRATLECELALTPAAEPLRDEAVRAAGGVPGGVSSKVAVSLDPKQRADSAAAQLLTELLATIADNLPGASADVDSEFLHDLRIAIRRTRCAQRQLKRVFPPIALAEFRRDFRRLQQVTGPSRDLDVHLLELDQLAATLPERARADLGPVRALLLERRARERRRMVRALNAPTTADLRGRWSAFLDDLTVAPETDRPDAARTIADVGGKRIAKLYRRMVEAGTAIDDESPAEALHELRKTGKELRYLLEFFAGVFPGHVVKPMVKTLKSLQDTLGVHQDRAVQVALLLSLRDDLAERPDGPAALMAVGLLVDRLEQEEARARAEFAGRFAAFADERRRALISETFG
jgi:CHAD domain-containing protein